MNRRVIVYMTILGLALVAAIVFVFTYPSAPDQSPPSVRPLNAGPG
jgi:hypothetical protein